MSVSLCLYIFSATAWAIFSVRLNQEVINGKYSNAVVFLVGLVLFPLLVAAAACLPTKALKK